MSAAMTPAQIIAEVQRVGGRLAFKPPNTLSVDLPAAVEPVLLPVLREHKPDLLRLLAGKPPADPCPACGGQYWWQSAPGGLWACGRCYPDPRAARWRGVTLATLGGRQVILRAPAGDLPAVGEWCRLPGGTIGDLLAYTPDGGEALLRLFNPPGQREPDPPRFVWVDSVRLAGEPEWCGCPRRA
jgi:hypothetical protein